MIDPGERLCIVCNKPVAISKASKLPIGGGMVQLFHKICLEALLEITEELDQLPVKKADGLGSKAHPNTRALTNEAEVRREELIHAPIRERYEKQEEKDRQAARIAAKLI